MRCKYDWLVSIGVHNVSSDYCMYCTRTYEIVDCTLHVHTNAHSYMYIYIHIHMIHSSKDRACCPCAMIDTYNHSA